MNTIAYWFLVFFLFSILGYFSEIIYCFIVTKKIVNRGMLHGPYCPIYGAGALCVIFFLRDYYSDPIALFIFGLLICSAIEYATSFVLEKVFNNKWWDYSNKKYNINGRVCLRNSVLFGLASVVVIYVLYPFIENIIGLIREDLLIYLSLIFFVIFIIDLVFTVFELNKLKIQLNIISKVKNDVTFKIPIIIQKKVNESLKKYKSYPKRILNAFPNIKLKHENNIKFLTKAIKNNKKK